MSLVFLYHGVIRDGSDVPPGREEGAELYDLNMARFEEHMESLAKQGVSVGTINGQQDLPPKVVITFDDGEENNFKNAFPILRRFNFPAYFFVTVSRIGKKGYMNWEHLKELRDVGMVVGSHGLNHLILTELKQKQLEEELAGSKDLLERHLKVNIKDFSVPRGFCSAKILEKAHEAGYTRIFVSEGKDVSAKGITRIAIKADWSLRRFEQALNGRTPIEEVGLNVVKSATKKVLGNTGYDNLRKTFLKLLPRRDKICL